ncbi:hypothetical protein E3G68_005250 [Mycobacteroides abscessus]|nr:hypothetical protein [Mycobacteroides abscessus]
MEQIDLEDAPWLAKTCWREAFLTSSAVASILVVQESTVRQYAAKAVPGFPVPARRESGRNYWTPDQVFRYIQSDRRQLMGRIPRLYCSQSSIVPAKFLFAERRTIVSDSHSPMERSSIDFAVHHWLPADGRGPIAVAYPGPRRGDDPGWKYAATLLAAMPNVEAVALVTDEVSIPHDHDGWQAAIGIAERGEPALDELDIPCPVRDRDRRPVVAEWGWYELANLLRVDIPWWPALLRDIDQMVAWLPGAPRQKIRPRTSTLNESNLLGLAPRVPPENAAKVRHLAVAMHRYLEGSDISVMPHGDRERPGICQAAEPLHVLPEIPAMPDATTIRWLLELPVDDTAAADRATRALDAIPGTKSIVADVLTTQGGSSRTTRQRVASPTDTGESRHRHAAWVCVCPTRRSRPQPANRCLLQTPPRSSRVGRRNPRR